MERGGDYDGRWESVLRGKRGRAGGLDAKTLSSPVRFLVAAAYRHTSMPVSFPRDAPC
jgi:hypothetical protein